MFVLDASMGWMLGGAAGTLGGLVLLVALARQRARRRRARDEAASRGELSVSVAPASVPAPVTGLAPLAVPDGAVSAAPAPAAPGAATPAAGGAARSPEAVRAEIAAHAERLAAARAARATAGPASPGAPRAAGAATPRPATQPFAERTRPGFDPTRSTPWQQVVESVARARSGDPAPAADAAGATGGHRAATAANAAFAAKALPVLSEQVHVPGLAGDADRPRRILVADDARVVRVKLQRLLAAQGWQVIEAADGDEALRLLASQRPDLLITDVDMPGLDGFALTRAVRAQASTAALPVIMITAADDQHRDEAARAGVTTLLGKPYGEAALLAHMRRLMGLKSVTAPADVAQPA